MSYFESLGMRDADAEWSPVEAPPMWPQPRAAREIRMPQGSVSLQDQAEAILRLLDNPSVLGAMPGRVTTPNRYDLQGTPAGQEWMRAVDPPARNLGDEMVMLAGGIASAPWRALPFGVRAAGQGITHLRALGNESQQAIDQIVRSFMNRLGRMPAERELIEALGLRGVEPGHAQPGGGAEDAQGGWDQPMLREGDVPGRMVGPGEAVAEPYALDRPQFSGDADAFDRLQNALRWVVTEAQERAIDIEDLIRGLGGRSFQTYTKNNLRAPTRYVGRTSGLGTSEHNVARRDADKYPSPDYERARLDRSSKRSSSIRGREQQMMDYDRLRGISDNRKNGIWPGNPLRSGYMRNADDEFGPLPPRRRK